MIEKTGNINQIRPDSNFKASRQKNSENKSNQILNNKLNENKLAENKLSAENLREELAEKIDDMNSITRTINENLSFKLHDDTNRLMVQVIDVESQEIIKEMPPEEMLDLAAKIHEMVGLLIDEKV